jgi:hypothetical protein
MAGNFIDSFMQSYTPAQPWVNQVANNKVDLQAKQQQLQDMQQAHALNEVVGQKAAYDFAKQKRIDGILQQFQQQGLQQAKAMPDILDMQADALIAGGDPQGGAKLKSEAAQARKANQEAAASAQKQRESTLRSFSGIFDKIKDQDSLNSVWQNAAPEDQAQLDAIGFPKTLDQAGVQRLGQLKNMALTQLQQEKLKQTDQRIVIQQQQADTRERNADSIIAERERKAKLAKEGVDANGKVTAVTERQITAADVATREATKALRNVAHIYQKTGSPGMTGIFARTGSGGLFGSSQDYFGASMNTEEEKQYAIAMEGLARAAGVLSKGAGASVSQGDYKHLETQITATQDMSKATAAQTLAEARQIVEQGIQGQLDRAALQNPAYSKTRANMVSALKQIHEAIPFTVQDTTDYALSKSKLDFPQWLKKEGRTGYDSGDRMASDFEEGGGEPVAKPATGKSMSMDDYLKQHGGQ